MFNLLPSYVLYVEDTALGMTAFFTEIKLTMSGNLTLIELQTEFYELADAFRTFGDNCAHNHLVTQAIPPCAQAVFVSEPLRFVITATDPCFAAFNAKLRPAMPLPITTKSYSFIPTGYCRSSEFPRRTQQARVTNSV